MMIALAEVVQRWLGGHVCLYEVQFCADAPMLPNSAIVFTLQLIVRRYYAEF